MRPVLLALVVLPLLGACSSAQPPATPDPGGTSLSRAEIVRAAAVAREVIAEQGASVSSATAVGRVGTVKHSNTGHPCTSGRELRIKLIGTFPHVATTGHPVPPGSPTPDFTVRAMTITADAASGLACLIGVETGEGGEPQPLVGGTPLVVGQPGGGD